MMMKQVVHNQIRRRAHAGHVMIGLLCCAALVAATTAFNGQNTGVPGVPPTVAIGDAAVSTGASPQTEQPASTSRNADTDATLVAVATNDATLATESTTSNSSLEQVDAFLAAGEYGAAVDIATRAEGITRDELMSRVILAQIKAGDAQAAQAILPQIATKKQRGAAEATLARNRALAGGMGADFDSLIELIQDETEGPWFEIDGIGGTMQEYESGVRVDPNGVLFRQTRAETNGELAALSTRARVAALNQDMAQPSTLRLVSLTRLEKEVARRLASGQPVVESMKQLAGLSQIQYVFVYPEEREIVIGGPAEGWQYNEFGMAVGTTSGRPTLHLDDLVTLMRTFSPDGMQIFGCSIDPQPENIKAVREFAAESQAKGALSPAGVRGWANHIGKILGLQNISIYGVPASSRVARVLVDADYRMKLIGIGKMKAGSNIPGYFDLLAREPALASGGLDALRWWMTMKYDEVLHSDDQNAFEVRGSAVLCRSENQFLTDNGERVNTGKAEPINQLFASNFTQHYPELAQQDPVFADLQNVFDLALVAALIHQDGLDQRLNWDRGVFQTNGAYQPSRYAVPKQVESVVNHRVYNGKDVVLQVAGGVRGDLSAVVSDSTIRNFSPRLDGIARKAKAGDLPADRWWWDAQ